MEVWTHVVVLRIRRAIFHIHVFLGTALALAWWKVGRETRLCVQGHTADWTKEGSEQDQRVIVQ